MMRFGIRFLVLAVCLGLLGVAGTARTAPVTKTGKAEEKAAKPPTAETIKKALDVVATIDYANQPLPVVLTSIGEEYKINIVLDRFAIQQNGVEPEQMMVDVHVKDVKLRSGLRTLLGQYNLSFGVVGDQVYVSSEDNVIHRQLKQRINVEFDDKPLSKALKDLSKEFAVNILIDPRSIKDKKADASVSLSLEDVPFETAVRLACEIGGLKPVRMGNVIFVTAEERADKLKDHDLAPASNNPGGIQGVFPGGIGGLGIGGIAVQAVPAPAPGIPVENPPKKEEEKKDEKK